jgi:hypothetical protein
MKLWKSWQLLLTTGRRMKRLFCLLQQSSCRRYAIRQWYPNFCLSGQHMINSENQFNCNTTGSMTGRTLNMPEWTHLRGVKQIVAIIFQSFIRGEYVQDTTYSWQILLQGNGYDFRVKISLSRTRQPDPSCFRIILHQCNYNHIVPVTIDKPYTLDPTQ